MTLRAHVGVSEFWSPVTPGQAGPAPAESSIEFRFLAKSALFYCVFLRRLSRNKAREREVDEVFDVGQAQDRRHGLELSLIHI